MNSIDNRIVFILDFDGVLCDSIEECMIVSYNAYYSNENLIVSNFPNSFREYFHTYRYLIRPAGEFYLIWESYFHNRDFKNISFEDMKTYYLTQITEFQSKFYTYREKLKRNRDYWTSLHKLYKNTLKFFSKYQDNIFIVTNKDRNSVEMIASAHGYLDKLSGIYSKEMSTDKSFLVDKLIHDQPHLSDSYNLYYIDDNEQNLYTVCKHSGGNINLTGLLARWGYCSEKIKSPYYQIDDILDVEMVIRSINEKN